MKDTKHAPANCLFCTPDVAMIAGAIDTYEPNLIKGLIARTEETKSLEPWDIVKYCSGSFMRKFNQNNHAKEARWMSRCIERN